MPKYFDAGKASTERRRIRKLGSLVAQSNISANNQIFSAINPEEVDIVVNALIIEVTTASGVANGTLTCGTGATVAAAKNATEFSNAASCASATVPFIHSAKKGDTVGARVNATGYIAAKLGGDANANAATLAGSVYVDYFIAE